MLFIAAALYCEALPFIEYFKLKKDNTVNKFQVFQGEGIRLLVTGTGSIPAAIGLTHLCTLYPPASSDFFLNAGICGMDRRDGGLEPGSICLCNKITDWSTKRSFYPDVLFSHPFIERGIVTWPFAVTGLKEEENRQRREEEPAESLFDMEAAGLYQAAVCFFKPHQMFFLKVVSDYGEGETIRPQNVTELMEKALVPIVQWYKKLGEATPLEEPVFCEEEEELIQALARGMLCSVTMEYQLKQLLHYHKVVWGNLKEAEIFLHTHPFPCKTKGEGKRYFERLKKELIGC